MGHSTRVLLVGTGNVLSGLRILLMFSVDSVPRMNSSVSTTHHLGPESVRTDQCLGSEGPVTILGHTRSE